MLLNMEQTTENSLVHYIFEVDDKERIISQKIKVS